MDLSKYEKIFLQESGKYFRELDQLLMEVEKDPGGLELWEEIHGKVHSIKGMAAALGYPSVSDLSHRIEAWCKAFQQGGAFPGKEAVQCLFDGLDALKGLVAAKGVVEDWGTHERLRTVSELFSSPPETLKVSEQARDPGSGPVSSGNGLPVSGRGLSTAAMDQVRVKYGIIEELLGLSQEILSLERLLPSISRKRLPPTTRSWVVHYSSMLKVFYHKLISLRLVSVGDFAALFSRLIRDQAKKHGKAVKFDIAGEEIQADIALLERLREPLMHLIRNSVAHGIETAEERLLAGKNPTGGLFMEAARHRDRLFITFGDDGRGIDRARIVSHLCEVRGLDRRAVEAMPERDLLAAICEPDYSTSTEVSDISGRGIGMNVVARTVKSLGGGLTIESKPGAGTRFTIQLPVTLSILSAVTFRLGGYTVSVPTAFVDGIGKRNPGSQDGGAGSSGTLSAMLNVDRGEGPLYRVKIREAGSGDGTPGESRVLVLEADSIVGNESVVVVPAGEFLSRAGFYSGVGVMEDGSLSVILDVDALFRKARSSNGGAKLPAAISPGGAGEVRRESASTEVADPEGTQRSHVQGETGG